MDTVEPIHVVIFAGILLALGLVLYVMQQKWNDLLTTGGRAMGEVVRHNLRFGRNTVVYSVVRFTTADGRLVEAEYTNGIATAIPSYRVGQRVRVAYDKASPTDFIIW